MSGWTKGPWEWDSGVVPPDGPERYADIYVDGGDKIIASFNEMREFAPDEGRANARLIAAAPDLAEACQPLAAIDIDHMADLPDDDRVVYLKNGIRLGDIRAARAALSKARGETP